MMLSFKAGCKNMVLNNKSMLAVLMFRLLVDVLAQAAKAKVVQIYKEEKYYDLKRLPIRRPFLLPAKH
jgi:hypothetical protein